MKLYLESGGRVYDLVDAATAVTWESTYRGGASRLEVTVLDGQFAPGNMLTLEKDGEKAFSGRVFTIREERSGQTQIVAYDQLRYLKAQDYIFRRGMPLEALLTQGCAALGLRLGECASTGFTLPDKTYEKKAWLDALYESIRDVGFYTGVDYCLWDDFGAIRLTPIVDLRQPLILGDGSLVTDYACQHSLEESANRIKLIQAGNGTRIYEDSATIQSWGVLQHLEKLDGSTNQAQADQLGKALLLAKNRVGEALTLSCLGDMRVRGGRGIRVKLSALQMDQWMVVNRVRHTITHGSHTMEVELLTQGGSK